MKVIIKLHNKVEIIEPKIIDDHNGSITINSSKNGTLVLLKLPLLFEKDIL